MWSTILVNGSANPTGRNINLKAGSLGQRGNNYGSELSCGVEISSVVSWCTYWDVSCMFPFFLEWEFSLHTGHAGELSPKILKGACAFVCSWVSSDGTDALYWFVHDWLVPVLVKFLWVSASTINATGGTSLRAQQSTHTWYNRILLITSGDLCKRPITPSNKHSQGGHEARGRLYEEPSHYRCRVELVFCSSLVLLVQSASGQRKSVPLQRIWWNYHVEAQQTYPKVWNINLNRRHSKKPTKISLRGRQNVLICG